MRFCITFAIVLVASSTAFAADTSVDFVRDVVPTLTKAGCNNGACHGSFQGRGGFTLSLLGWDPAMDFDAIRRAGRGRRVDLASPANSLLLRKPTGAIAHGGGKRLNTDSTAYRIIHDFIAQGMPSPLADAPKITSLEVLPADLLLKPDGTSPIRVNAKWSDGSTRDVTAWALFDSRDTQACDVSRDGVVTAHRPGRSSVSVRYQGLVASVAVSTPYGSPIETPDFKPRNFIDGIVQKEWQRLGVKPAPCSSDAEFFRRAYLDLIGTLPTPDEAKKFLADTDANKRSKLVEELLERPEYVDHWSMKWSDLLRVHRRYVGDKGLGTFSGWIRRAVRENMPFDKLTRELLTAQGNLFAHGPVAFYFVDSKPEEFAETTAQVFLGVRLQCCRCHHHPFEVWAREDYFGLAAFFTRLEIRENGDKGRFGGLQTLRAVAEETKKLDFAAKPRALGADAAPPSDDPRVALADWVTSKSNPYFARNFTNRIWSHLTGRGLVEPVDDLRATNPATYPALLDALAKNFADHGFDAKHLIRTICNSAVYQLASEIAPDRDRDASLLTHRKPRRLSAEVLLDAVNQATSFNESFVGNPPGTRAIALPDPTIPSPFLVIFGRPLRNNACDCSRETAPDLLQALHLLNNPEFQAKISGANGRLAKLLESKKTDAEAIEELYLATYSRKPSDREMQTVQKLIAGATNRKEALEDLFWTLLNTPEFSFNH